MNDRDPLPIDIRLAVRADLERLEWGGLYSEHRALAEAAYRRQQQGAVAMLIAVANGFPVGQAWIDLELRAIEDAAVIWAVRVLPALQGRAIGTRIIAAAERLGAAEGFGAAEIGVEKSNPEARRWYERLGYCVFAEMRDVTRFVAPNGERQELVFDQWRLRKALMADAASQPDDHAS
jgi:ribosomal protein S18 acetylase RimI-like enzyme